MRPEQLTGKKVLLGCLDWGSGHIARSVPLVHQLLNQGNTVIAWCSEDQRTLFSTLFPEVPTVIGFSTDFRFKGDGHFSREILRNSMHFIREKRREQRAVEAFVRSNQVDVLLSDHRYGMVSTHIPSIFITHQVHLPRKAGFVAQCLHRRWMSRFTGVWIMDEEQDRLAGELSRKINNKYICIGHYSRFSAGEVSEIPGSVVAIISGPEPYSDQLAEQLFAIAEKSPENWTFICPDRLHRVSDTVRFISDWKQGDAAIRSAELIISRNGYSTLMDLKVLGKRAILIPTPGQLEQEYLGRIAENELWRVVNDFNQIITSSKGGRSRNIGLDHGMF